MELKKGNNFKKLKTIKDFQTEQEEMEHERIKNESIDQYAEEVEKAIEAQMVKIAREYGYPLPDNPTPETAKEFADQMYHDGFEIVLEQNDYRRQSDDKLVYSVTLSVKQVHTTIEFDLEEES